MWVAIVIIALLAIHQWLLPWLGWSFAEFIIAVSFTALIGTGFYLMSGETTDQDS